MAGAGGPEPRRVQAGTGILRPGCRPAQEAGNCRRRSPGSVGRRRIYRRVPTAAPDSADRRCRIRLSQKSSPSHPCQRGLFPQDGNRATADNAGDAARIWSDTPTATVLRERLENIPGIGQKKAAMAVEILARDLDVPLREMGGSDIAHDVHVRRIFLRTGLASRDEVTHMVAVARTLNPEPRTPGALDLPAWDIGRRWCRPTAPDCPACPLNAACPRLLRRGSQIKGI
jgi:hypothetical protein